MWSGKEGSHVERIIRTITPLATVPYKKNRVAAYARVSSDKEAMLHSLSAQVSYYSDYIQQHSEWEYAGVYADEAMTGTRDSRPDFQRMLNDCRDGLIDMVITKSISRFARNTVTMLETLRELRQLEVDVYFEKENIHSISGDGEFMLTILASYAQAESLSVSENCKWRIRKRFQAGEIVNLRFMYGYNIKKGEITASPYHTSPAEARPTSKGIRAPQPEFKGSRPLLPSGILRWSKLIVEANISLHEGASTMLIKRPYKFMYPKHLFQAFRNSINK
jgi:DNA invertase Pin-like site-specific DNA recombinase